MCKRGETCSPQPWVSQAIYSAAGGPALTTTCARAHAHSPLAFDLTQLPGWEQTFQTFQPLAFPLFRWFRPTGAPFPFLVLSHPCHSWILFKKPLGISSSIKLLQLSIGECGLFVPSSLLQVLKAQKTGIEMTNEAPKICALSAKQDSLLPTKSTPQTSCQMP